MAKDKISMVIPNEELFGPAPIPFGVVSGEGVDNYNEDGKEYTVSIILTKKQAKHVKDQVLEFWENNKPSGAGDEPSNIEGIVRKGKDDYEGSYIMYAKTQADFEGKAQHIPMVNQSGDKIDTEEYGLIGKGSEGRIAATLRIYAKGKKVGVSVFLTAVKLTKYAPLESSGGTSLFTSTDEGEIDSTGGFKSDKKKKKHDEDEIKPKKKHDDDDDDEVKPKKKDKKKKKKNKE